MKISVLGGWSPGKFVCVLENFDKALLENYICSCGNFVLLENCMCSCKFFISCSWKIISVLEVYPFSWKIWCVLSVNNVRKYCLLDFYMCSFLHSCLLENCMCSIYFEKKRLFLEKKNRYFVKIARRLLLFFWAILTSIFTIKCI